MNIITKIRIWWLKSEIKAAAESADYHKKRHDQDMQYCVNMTRKLLAMDPTYRREQAKAAVPVHYTWKKS